VQPEAGAVLGAPGKTSYPMPLARTARPYVRWCAQPVRTYVHRTYVPYGGSGAWVHVHTAAVGHAQELGPQAESAEGMQPVGHGVGRCTRALHGHPG
jgi:hypothetical protein